MPSSLLFADDPEGLEHSLPQAAVRWHEQLTQIHVLPGEILITRLSAKQRQRWVSEGSPTALKQGLKKDQSIISDKAGMKALHRKHHNGERVF